MACPPCKIILDNRVLAAAGRFVAALMKESAPVVAAATLIAETADAAAHGFTYALLSESLSAEELDEAHAMSELSCHRAAQMRGWAVGGWASSGTRTERMISWAEELRTHTTKLFGGEYSGAWEVIGVDRIQKKDVTP